MTLQEAPESHREPLERLAKATESIRKLPGSIGKPPGSTSKSPAGIAPASPWRASQLQAINEFHQRPLSFCNRDRSTAVTTLDSREHNHRRDLLLHKRCHPCYRLAPVQYNSGDMGQRTPIKQSDGLIVSIKESCRQRPIVIGLCLRSAVNRVP